MIDLVEIPVPTQALADSAAGDVLVVDHYVLGLHQPLDAGQRVLLHDLDGARHGATVRELEFTAHTTLYHFEVGQRVAEAEARRVGAYDRPRPAHGHLTTEDVLDALGHLAALNRRNETCREIDRHTVRGLIREALNDVEVDVVLTA